MICRSVQFKHQNTKTKTLVISIDSVLIHLLKLAQVSLAGMLAVLSRRVWDVLLFMLTQNWPFLFLSLLTLV